MMIGIQNEPGVPAYACTNLGGIVPQDDDHFIAASIKQADEPVGKRLAAKFQQRLRGSHAT
jgi:hypothetical protein